MNFDDLKERILSSFKQIWDRIQDSSLYNQLRDRFENLSPRAQKGAIAGFILVIAMMVFSVPYGYWSQSQISIKGFEDRRDIVRRLLKASRDAADVPNIPQAPTPEGLKSQVDALIAENQLMPTQIKSVEIAPLETQLIPANMAQGSLAINLAKLNLRQIVNIGFKLKSLSPSVKMTALQIFPNAQDARYFDVNFRMTSLAVPQIAPPPVPEPEEPVKRPSFRKGKNSKSKESPE